MKSSTRLRVRSNTLSELEDETEVNLIVGYRELIKSVNSFSSTGPWVQISNISSLYLHHRLGLISPYLALLSIISIARSA